MAAFDMSSPRSLTDRELLDLVNETREALSEGADRLNVLTGELKRRLRELDNGEAHDWR